MTWDEVSFSTLYAVPSKNGLMAPSKSRGTGVALINMKEVFAYDRIAEPAMELAPLPNKNREQWLVQPGDLLFARQSLVFEGAGKCVLVLPAEIERTFESHLIKVRLDSEVSDPQFFYYYFSSPVGRENMSTIVEQVAAAGIRSSDLANLRVPIPPLEEQRGISSTLSSLDERLDSNDRTIVLARELMRSLYRSATDGDFVKASTVLTPILGGTPLRSQPGYWGGDIPWASAKDIAASSTGYVLNTAESITSEGVENSAAKVLPDGTIVMTARGTVGALARLVGPMAFNQSCYGLVPKPGVQATLLFVALEDALQRIRDAGHGTVFNTVNMATFDQIDLALPASPSAELLEQLDALSALILARVHESNRLVATRDVLLSDLFSRRIQVSEAREQPA